MIDKKEDIKNLSVKKREIRFLKTKSIVQAVIGPRRAGKSFSLFYFMKSQKLKDEDFVFVNFEDDEIKRLQEREKKKLVRFHVEIYELKCKDLLVITWDYEGEEIISNRKVKFVPLWKWLLSF